MITNVLYQLVVCLFYILFFAMVFFKIRNIVLVRKLNNKEFYKNTQKKIKNNKLYKYLSNIDLCLIIIAVLYIVVGIGLSIITFTLTIFALPMLFSGHTSTIYDIFLSFVTFYFSLLKYVVYYFYFTTFILFITSIYSNCLIHKELKIH